jgi:hypothetical protein
MNKHFMRGYFVALAKDGWLFVGGELVKLALVALAIWLMI